MTERTHLSLRIDSEVKSDIELLIQHDFQWRSMNHVADVVMTKFRDENLELINKLKQHVGGKSK